MVKQGKTYTVKVQIQIMQLKQFRAEVAKEASAANKRLDRLERSDFSDLWSYKEWKKKGKKRFSTKGLKTREDLEKERQRIKDFVTSATGSVKQARAYLKESMARAGIASKNVKSDITALNNFWQLVGKAQQALDPSSIFSSLSSDQQKEDISKFIKSAKIDLHDSQLDVEAALEGLKQAQEIEDKYELGDIGDGNYILMKK